LKKIVLLKFEKSVSEIKIGLYETKSGIGDNDGYGYKYNKEKREQSYEIQTHNSGSILYDKTWEEGER